LDDQTVVAFARRRSTNSRGRFASCWDCIPFVTLSGRLGESGADAFTIMKLMRHSTITVSQRYVHPSPESVERAVSRMEALNTGKLNGVGILSGIPGRAVAPAAS